VHPAQIVESAREQVEHAIAARDVRVNVRSDTLVRLDPRLTAAGLSHLLDNAAKYSPSAQPIEVNVAVDNGALVIAVRANGTGVSAADLPRLFARLYRGAPTSRVFRTGMCLGNVRVLGAVRRGHVCA